MAYNSLPITLDICSSCRRRLCLQFHGPLQESLPSATGSTPVPKAASRNLEATPVRKAR